MPIPKCICCVCKQEVNKRQTMTHPNGRMCITHQEDQMSVVREAKMKAYDKALMEYCQSKLFIFSSEMTPSRTFEDVYKCTIVNDKKLLESHLKQPTHFMDSCPLTKVAGTLPEITVEKIFQDAEKIFKVWFNHQKSKEI